MYFYDYVNVKIKFCGLNIFVDYLFLGVLLDVYLYCKCCGKGLVEVKCLYLYRNEILYDVVSDFNYYLYRDINDVVKFRVDFLWYV